MRETVRRVAAIVAACAVCAAAESATRQQPDGRMDAWATALGVDCAYCHVPGDWSNPSVPAFAFAQRMMRMVDGLNAGPLRDFRGVTCWTCHRGRTIPARLPLDAWQLVQKDHAAEFEAQPSRAIAMSVYAASLGVDCSFCHEADRTANGQAPKATATRMLEIFDEIPKYFDASRMPTTQCFMCHQGARMPQRAPGA